jgi:hypothetical protein
MILSTVVGGFLVWNEVNTGGMQVKWTLKETDANGYSGNNYGIASVENGTLIVADYLWLSNGHHGNFVALDQNGSTMWRAGFNGYPWQLIKSTDGGYYYVDFKNDTDFLDYSKGLNQNLTALDSNGQYRWSFHVDNGTLQIWAVYPDGEVIANHYKELNYYIDYNTTSGKYENQTNEMIALSSTGQVIWSKSLIVGNETMVPFNRSIDPNGTFIAYYNGNGSYQVGYDRTTGQSYKVAVNYSSINAPNGPNSLFYSVNTEAINSTTTMTTVQATNTNDGSIAWKIVLDYADNAENLGGALCVGSCFVDGIGTIYGYNYGGEKLFAASSNGKLLWERSSPGQFVAICASGGVLFRADSSIVKVNPDGSNAWEYEVGVSHSADLVETALSPDGTVYYVQDNSLVALAHSDFSNNLTALTALIVADLVMVIYYFIKRNRHHAQAKAS